MKIFTNRERAGEELAQMLLSYKDKKPIVLAIPRGGVPVATRVAQVLQCPMDILMVKKIGAPQQPELAVGAITESGDAFFDDALIKSLDISSSYLENTSIQKFREMREKRKSMPRLIPTESWRNKVVILVDDGIATGATLQAAIHLAHQQAPQKIIVAAPVASKTSTEILKKLADEVVCLSMPESFSSVSSWYEDFSQITDTEISTILEKMKIPSPDPVKRYQ